MPKIILSKQFIKKWQYSAIHTKMSSLLHNTALRLKTIESITKVGSANSNCSAHNELLAMHRTHSGLTELISWTWAKYRFWNKKWFYVLIYVIIQFNYLYCESILIFNYYKHYFAFYKTTYRFLDYNSNIKSFRVNQVY